MKNYLSTTKGSFRRTSKTKQRVTRTVALAAILVIGLWLTGSAFIYLGNVVFLPIRYIDTWLSESTAAFPSYVRDRSSLVDELAALQAEIATIDETRDRVSVLEAENETLKNLGSEDRIVAGVIGAPGELPYDTLLLDQGSEAGIVAGATVFRAPDQVIGTVVWARANSSLVELVTTSGTESTVYILGPDIYTTAVGLGGGVLQVSVPQGIPLEIGQSVILPGVSGGVFGKIEIIDPRPTRPAQYGYVQTGVPILSTRLVSVSRTAAEPITFEAAKAVVDEVKQAALIVPVPGDVLIDVSTTTATSSSITASTSDNTSTP